MRTQLSGNQIANGTIKTAKIGDRQVTDVKLSLTGIVPGTYNSLTVDAQGRVVSGVAGVPWSEITGVPVILPNLSRSVQVPAVSGTSLIPFDNTTPTVSEGTQIAAATCNPSDANSKLAISGALLIDCSSANKNFTLAAFRGSTCIGATSINFVSSGKPQMLPFSFVDPTTGSFFGSSLSYTLRVGVNSAATWYVNRMATAALNGMMAMNNVIFWEYI